MAKSQHYNNNDRLDVLPIHEDSQLEIEVAYRAWNYHRTITFLAGIDLVFSLLYGGFVNPLLTLFALFPIFGIYGAKTFRKSCIVLYMLYITFQAIYVWFGIVVSGFFVFYLISFCIHLWCLKIVGEFYLDLNRLSPETIIRLRNGTLIPQVVNIVLW